jgi:tetratricopeptide (TPR) repeat protein
MVYHVAIDDREATTESYMIAANAMGIPHAFLVDREGKIAWQGSPLDPAMDHVIAGLVSGTYDPKLEAELDRRFRALEWPLSRGQWDVVIDGLTDVLKIAPGNETALRALQRIHVDELGQTDTFRQWARKHIDQHRDNSTTMQMLAMILVESDMSFQSAPELALEAAQLAFDSAKTPDASILSLYALAHYRIGDLERAIAFQQQAVEVASGEAQDQAKTLHEFYNKCKSLRRSRS